MEKINFVFFGTPHVASDTLEILFLHGIVPSVIVTSPDRPSGRGMKTTSSPVTSPKPERFLPIPNPAARCSRRPITTRSHPLV